jgi:hypothetical protein
LRKKWIILIVIALSLMFNIGFALSSQNNNRSSSWLFVDLGPAIMQDSYYFRAPGLESPYGMIGDIPGGYPLYSGSPLQETSPENITDSSGLTNWQFAPPVPSTNTVFLAICFAVVPVALILIIGRKSYGSTKTQ